MRTRPEAFRTPWHTWPPSHRPRSQPPCSPTTCRRVWRPTKTGAGSSRRATMWGDVRRDGTTGIATIRSGEVGPRRSPQDHLASATYRVHREQRGNSARVRNCHGPTLRRTGPRLSGCSAKLPNWGTTLPASPTHSPLVAAHRLQRLERERLARTSANPLPPACAGSARRLCAHGDQPRAVAMTRSALGLAARAGKGSVL